MVGNAKMGKCDYVITWKETKGTDKERHYNGCCCSERLVIQYIHKWPRKESRYRVTKFAADEILFKVFNSQIDCKGLQEDFTILNDWTVKWQTKFKVNICKEMHMEKHILNCTYRMMGPKLAIASQERDLAIIIAGAIKTSVKCSTVVRGAKSMIRMVRKWNENKIENIIMPLYKRVVYHMLNSVCSSCLCFLKREKWNKKYQGNVVTEVERLLSRKNLNWLEKRWLRMIWD